MRVKAQHILGDCGEVLDTIPKRSVALIVTSPPYADARRKQYGAIEPNRYPDWFASRAEAMKRVLRLDGTLILNIKERVVKGERHPYVLRVVMNLRDNDWRWTEEWVWHKKNCTPGKWRTRFRDAWEHIHQFNLDANFAMYQDEVMVPMGEWAKSRLAHLSETDKVRDPSGSGSNFGKNVSNWAHRTRVYPTNVLHLATECGNKGHSAAFPESLPEFFIKLFTREGDTVLDPFEGSGTTGAAAVRLGRNYIGVDSSEKYIALATERVATALASAERQTDDAQGKKAAYRQL
jgi:site-specific DNA-methyltransferase (adenine-specific)